MFGPDSIVREQLLGMREDCVKEAAAMAAEGITQGVAEIVHVAIEIQVLLQFMTVNCVAAND